MTNSAEKYGGLQHFVSELMRDTDHCIENFLFKHNQVLLQMKQDREQNKRDHTLPSRLEIKIRKKGDKI